MPAGIDVSRFQAKVDWPAVAAAGRAFAYIKATEGATYRDPKFAAHWAGAKAAGMLRGAYHFFRPAKPAAAQVENFCSLVGALASGDLPPMLDLEETPGEHDEWTTIPKPDRRPLALEWLHAVEERLGRRPIVYTRRGFISTLGGAGGLAQYPLWVAHYTQAAKPAVPAGWQNWTLWQYSDAGQVPGIAGKVDLDRFAGTLEELRALAGLTAAEAGG